MQTLLTLTWSHAGVTAYAPVIVVLTSFSLLDLTLVLPSALIALNVPEQLKAIQRAKRWDWTLLFQWDLGCNPPPCWIISSQRRGGVKVALPWYLLSTGDNGITVDSIVVSGGYMNVICRGAWLHSGPNVSEDADMGWLSVYSLNSVF